MTPNDNLVKQPIGLGRGQTPANPETDEVFGEDKGTLNRYEEHHR